MDAFTVHSDVNNGLLAEGVSKHIRRMMLEHFEGKRVTVTIKRFVKTRSSNQNRFLHGVMLPALQSMFRSAGSELSIEQVKEFFKEKFGKREMIVAPDGTAYEILKSTAKYSTIECEDAMEKCRAWAAHYGQSLPFPNEQMLGAM